MTCWNNSLDRPYLSESYDVVRHVHESIIRRRYPESMLRWLENATLPLYSSECGRVSTYTGESVKWMAEFCTSFPMAPLLSTDYNYHMDYNDTTCLIVVTREMLTFVQNGGPWVRMDRLMASPQCAELCCDQLGMLGTAARSMIPGYTPRHLRHAPDIFDWPTPLSIAFSTVSNSSPISVVSTESDVVSTDWHPHCRHACCSSKRRRKWHQPCDPDCCCFNCVEG